MKYRVNWAYCSERYGPWAAGDLVDLDEESAAYIMRDSPGVLNPLPQAQDRQLKRPRNRRETEHED